MNFETDEKEKGLRYCYLHEKIDQRLKCNECGIEFCKDFAEEKGSHNTGCENKEFEYVKNKKYAKTKE